MHRRGWVLLGVLVSTLSVTAAELPFNELRFENPPKWVKSGDIRAALRKAERALEWDLRRVTVKFEPKAEVFLKSFGFSAEVLAFSDKSAARIVMGPLVTGANFEEVLTHEIVHHAIAQKYKAAIPVWLEEGLANHIARPGRKPNYALLKQQAPFEVFRLGHPFKDPSLPPRVHYEASLALAKLLDRKCGLMTLLQLSVGRSVEGYLATTCGIENLSGAYQRWVQQ
jgi:hypothetical protein